MARVATYLPLIPVVVLIVLLVTCGGLGKYQVGKYRTPVAEREFNAAAWNSNNHCHCPKTGHESRAPAAAAASAAQAHSVDEWQVMQILSSTWWGSSPRPARRAPTSP